MNMIRFGCTAVSAALLALSACGLPVLAMDGAKAGGKAPMLRVNIPKTTQGPLWPPSALVDANGDFIVVGIVLREDANGNVEMVFDQPALVDKHTVPPLDATGREDFSNPFGAPYRIKRYLDLSEGSPDLNIVVHTNSYGPHTGEFGGGPRIPREGETIYNLNSFHTRGENCPDLFPARSQRTSYTRPSYPLHQAPIWGLQGDQIAFDADTGDEFVPSLRNGAECAPDGCPGEDPFMTRRQEPITLGEWLRTDVDLTVKLVDFDAVVGAYTAAEFEMVGRDMLPNSIYTVVAARASFLNPSPIQKMPHPATVTSHIITDERGRGRVRFKMTHPFPDPAGDDAGLRLIGLGVGYKSDYSVFGGCSLRFGAGVDIHAAAFTAAQGNFDFTPFVTQPPRAD
ncbi:MAG: hypothetical protein U1A22_07235 [Xanthomonadaceae bacterium]|nr:hypothetical protein [Xanthomonadaceae bacterium]